VCNFEHLCSPGRAHAVCERPWGFSLGAPPVARRGDRLADLLCCCPKPPREGSAARFSPYVVIHPAASFADAGEGSPFRLYVVAALSCRSSPKSTSQLFRQRANEVAICGLRWSPQDSETGGSARFSLYVVIPNPAASFADGGEGSALHLSLCHARTRKHFSTSP